MLEAPDLPEGTLTVRVARGGIADTLVDTEVALDVDGKRRSARTDDKGRARFDGLPVGATVVASLGEARTPAAKVPAGAGARLLLFVPPAPAEAPAAPPPAAQPATSMPGMPDPSAMSGIPLPSPELPIGTLLVRIAKGSLRDSMPGAEVVVEAGGKRYTAKADEQGRARFEGIARGVEAVASVGEIRTPSFVLPESSGARMLLFVPGPAGAPPAPSAPSALPTGGGDLVISAETHIVAEIADDKLELFEALHLVNPGPPRAGTEIVIPLPEGASDVSVDPEMEGRLRPQDGSVVLAGPLPSGPLQLRVSFRLPIENGKVVLRQPARLAWDGFGVVVRESDGLTLEGPGISPAESRAMESQRFLVARGGAVPAGGMIEVRFGGLPSVDSTGRNAAALLAFGVIGWAVVATWRAPTSRSQRGKLGLRRAHLMSELVAIERRRRAGEAVPDRGRAELLAEIEALDRSLDELPV